LVWYRRLNFIKNNQLDGHSNDVIDSCRIRKIMGEVISGAYPAPTTEPIVETVEVEVEDEVVDE